MDTVTVTLKKERVFKRKRNLEDLDDVTKAICNRRFLAQHSVATSVATLFQLVATLFQHCNAGCVVVKIVVANRPVYHQRREGLVSFRLVVLLI